MKIGITGSSGQLGRELVKLGGIPLSGRFHSDELLTSVETIKPDAIINCAAMTNVDYCEGNVLEAAATNAAGVQFLSSIFSGYLIQISTDYVFDGVAGPYGVRDAPNPIGVYGWSKLGGELAAKRHRGPSLIIRTTVLFSETTNNFVAKIVKQLKAGGEINIYNPDIVGTPTYVPALAAEIMRVVEGAYTGVAHIVGSKHMSRFDFTRMISQAFGYNPDKIVANHQAIEAAPRPQRGGLICDHDGYQPIKSHDVYDGLVNLSRTEGVFDERTMERVATG